MMDLLIMFAFWVIGSLIWLVMQAAFHFLMVRTHEAYRTVRGMIFGAMLGFPVFAFLVYFVMKLWNSTLTWTHVVVMPFLIAWALAVALAGVHIAARLRGVLNESAPK